MNTTANPVPTTTVYSLDDERFTFTNMRAVLQELAGDGSLKLVVAFYAVESVPCIGASYFDVAGDPFPYPLGPERARTCEALAAVVRDYRNEFRQALPLTNPQLV